MVLFRMYEITDETWLRILVRSIGAGFALMGVFVFMQGPFSKLELFGHGVMGGIVPFRNWIPISEIKALRVVEGRIPSLLIVGERNRISWDLLSLRDDHFRHWLLSLPNLSGDEKQAIVVAQTRLGSFFRCTWQSRIDAAWKGAGRVPEASDPSRVMRV